MRIAIGRAGRLGGDGVSRVIECWARILGEAGHATTVVSEAAADQRLPTLAGVREEHFDTVRRSRLTRYFVTARACAGKIGELAEGDGIDLVISHDALLTLALRRVYPRMPILGTFHSPIIDENRLNNWKYTRNLGRRLTYPATWLILKWVERRALELVTRAHTLSDFTWDLLRSNHPQICRTAMWHRIPGSFDPGQFSPSEDRERLRADLGLGTDETVLLTVRRLVPRNGVERIVRYAVRHRDRLTGVRILIGGTGPLARDLANEIESAGLSDTVRFLGFIPEERLASYYRCADAFLLPTRDLECFGLPVIEAMACGTVPLVMPEGGPAEICRTHSEWIARANTDDAFDELIDRFLSGDITRRPPGIECAASETYSNAAIRPQILELVEALTSGGPVLRVCQS